MSKRTRKMLLSLMVVGVIGSVAGWGVYAAFTATTTNTGNTITAGTVNIAQHAGSTTLYSASNQGPGASTVGCIRVTYTGSLASSVKLYTPSSVTNGTAFNLQVERGSGLSSPDNTMNCTGFTSSSTAYNGTSGASRPRTPRASTARPPVRPGRRSDAVDYRFTITVVDDPTPGAHTSALGSGAHTFTWEARNN